MCGAVSSGQWLKVLCLKEEMAMVLKVSLSLSHLLPSEDPAIWRLALPISFIFILAIHKHLVFWGEVEGGEDGNIPSPLLWRQQWGKVIAGWKFPGASHLPSLQCPECILDCSSGLFYKCWSILPAPWLNASNLFKDKLSQKFESHGGFPSDNACKLGFLCLSAIPLLLYVPYINIEPAKKKHKVIREGKKIKLTLINK